MNASGMAMTVDARGFSRPAIELPVRSPTAEVLVLPVVYATRADGLVNARDAAGTLVGNFVNQELAERTVKFLSQ